MPTLTDFCSVVPFAKPGIRPRLRANRKIMLFCCISVRQHTTMWMKPGSYYSLTSHNRFDMQKIPKLLMSWNNMCKKALYQAWHIWGQSLIGTPVSFQSQIYGLGRESLMELLWSRTGPLFQRQLKLVRSCWNVDVRSFVQKGANVWKLISRVHMLCFCSAQCVRDYSI